MEYSAKFRHIDKDFGFDELDLGTWLADYDNEDDFILALNRMAIATSLHSVVDFPEVEVRAKSMRVTIHAIDGELFYTDLHSQNRKNMKVIPVEVVRLLEGKPLDEVFKQEEEAVEEAYEPSHHAYRKSSSGTKKLVALVVMFCVIGVCSFMIWKELGTTPSLTSVPQFIPDMNQEGEVLRKYADVYVSEYREGAMLFELTKKGEFTRYEMWFSKDRNAYILLQVDSHRAQVGSYSGKDGILAGGEHLLVLKDEEAIILHGVEFTRHHDTLSSIGEVLSK